MKIDTDLAGIFRRMVVLVAALPAAGCGSTIASVDAAANPPTDAPVSDGTGVDTPPPVGRRDCRVIAVGGGDPCTYLVETPCETDPTAVTRDGFCAFACARDGGFLASCSARGVGASGGLLVACTTCAIGRRPEGLCLGEDQPGTLLGRFFARVAAFEAASVPAFEMLAEELWAQGAPKNFVQRCLAAADDERRHAVSMGALARRFGSAPGGFTVLSSVRQSAREIALHNAVEGCVREAYGALLATWQADHAQDPVVRRAMRTIAEDETRHAELSFDIARWFDSTLDAHAREASLAARKEALLNLREDLLAPIPEALDCDAGMPVPARALALWSAFAEELHADALAA